MRFVRISLPSDSIALGELAFYDAQGKIKNIKVVSHLQSLSENEEVDVLFDGFTSTCYRGKSKAKYVDVDLGKEYEVRHIVVAPYVMSQIFGNSEYELFYWKNSKWELFEKQNGSGTDLIFKNVPGDALFRLVQMGGCQAWFREKAPQPSDAHGAARKLPDVKNIFI